MRNFIWSFLAFFCLISSAFSQTINIEKGSYLSTGQSQKIKLNLLDNNKYELVFYSGDYEIKGDSLLFTPSVKAENMFDLTFKNDKKAKKIKVKFVNPNYNSFYIGTQKKSDPIQYERLADIGARVNPNYDKIDVDFEIDRADYLYLIYELYGGDSKVSKFALPKDVSEVTIQYNLDATADLNITGFYDQKTKDLMILEQSVPTPLIFRNAKDVQPEKVSKVIALENKTITNWTYPGKEPLVSDDFGTAVDSTVVVADTTSVATYDFKLKIENNLKSAISSNKTAKTKFLVVELDSKNASAKTDFDAFIKDQETQISYAMYDEYNPEYDLYNFYLATADDKKWLKTNKITDTPCLIILNNNGEVLATVKTNLSGKQYQFNYYDALYRKLQRTDGLLAFNKIVKNKKATDSDLIQAFNKISVLEIPYDYDTDYTLTDDKPIEFKFVNTTVDKKEVAQIWKKLIEAHQKDAKPNMYLVETILKEIKNQGFSKQFIKDDKVLNDTDYLAIDYLIKHYDAIDAQRLAFNSKEGETHSIESLNTEIAAALQQNKDVEQNDISGSKNKNQNKTISIYKKLIALGKGNFDCYQNYFIYLAELEDKDGSNTTYLKEFSTYFDSYLTTDRVNPIVRLDELFTLLDENSGYSSWNYFKEYHSNLANSAAWTVVSKPGNTAFIKSAIIWSEYSLVVTKNNPYYLDTLAQLYYKDGQKQKAIETQTLAVKYLTDYVEEETATEIKETLSKMQNGTY
ncbi:hypothetical protein NJT12_20550 [Flavobacterium sp. AC]|uniref:Uncharacterized protein n=1 Tax=Flavobacterium azizsancarii TaxID=2961580 RepID=A0ABT4WHF8_9FLAO|nr:hypothetical protein [Flavobacterium azizsancarii]MDA6072019.1 hypothetical protein [Flavobacterium azizsancarii]